MTVISKGAFKPPTLPAETVEVLGLVAADKPAEVIVLGLDAGKRLDLRTEESLSRGDFAIRLLAMCVVDVKREQLMDETGWRAWSAKRPEIEFWALVNTAMRLSGFIEPEKKT